MRIADAADVDTEQLELGAHVRPAECGCVARDRPGRDLRHLVTGTHESEDAPVEERALADGVHVGIGRATGLVDDDAAARAHFEPACPRKFIARANAGGEDDEIGLQRLAVRELETVAAVFAVHDAQRAPVRVHDDAEILDHAAQHGAAAFVQLRRHQARRELDHVRLESHVPERVRCLEPEQATADDDAGARVGT